MIRCIIYTDVSDTTDADAQPYQLVISIHVVIRQFQITEEVEEDGGRGSG